MFDKSAIGVFIVESPVHCGMGQDVGVVDQPVQRERHTGYPIIQGSEVKGCFRQYYEKKFDKGNNVLEIFGPEESGDEDTKYASAVSFGDARVLFFPVKSLKGTYVWITSKDVLEKFGRILKMAGFTDLGVPPVTEIKDDEIAIPDVSISVEKKVVLEEYVFTQKETQVALESIITAVTPTTPEYKYLLDALKKKLCIVSDDTFKEFVTMSTEVITRIRINNETGVVDKGALWTEEYIPTDTILYFPVFASRTRNSGNGKLDAQKVIDKVKSLNSYIQIGGNETVGKGFVRINWIDGKDGESK